MIWLGVQFTTEDMRMKIPLEKLREVSELVETWVTRKTSSQSQLRGLLGKLFFVASCSPTLRLFCNRLLEGIRNKRENEVVMLGEEFHRHHVDQKLSHKLQRNRRDNKANNIKRGTHSRQLLNRGGRALGIRVVQCNLSGFH